MDAPTLLIGGLLYPEGPVALPDGTLLVVEIEGGYLTRICKGRRTIVAHLGGGPNGAAIGPDGCCYVCNNGGFKWAKHLDGYTRPLRQAEDYSCGRIERVDLLSSCVEILYSHCSGRPLKGPNDLVFDKHGGFYFTDLGKGRERDLDRGALYYALPDGSAIEEVAFPIMTPNGVGLSPDGSLVYVAETETARLWAWPVLSPGKLAKESWPSPHGGSLVASVPGYQRFDSLAIEECGNICIATLNNGGINIISPEGKQLDHVALPDILTTNICFGGKDRLTAYVTLSGSGRVVTLDWPRPGLALHFLDRAPTIRENPH